LSLWSREEVWRILLFFVLSWRVSGVREVGIAAADRFTGRVVSTQVADCQTYVKTIASLHLYPPSVIIAPHTFFKPSRENGPTHFTNPLLEYLQDEFAVPIEPLDRRYWSAEAGVSSVRF
jgi:DNA mismatch repair protein MSH4